jgi:hypothetical protein
MLKFIYAIVIMCFGLNTFAAENDWFVSSDAEPIKAPNQSINSAESVTDYPGPPGVPQRTSERKKPPEPDYLSGKVIWGESATYTNAGGDKRNIADWNLVNRDLEGLIDCAKDVGLAYHYTNINLKSFSYDPKKMPSLFFSGVRSMKFSEEELTSLRRYILKGGMVICDSVYGSPYFYKSSKDVFNKVFPESKIRTIPKDHPFYHMFYDIEEVTYPEIPNMNQPFLEGIYIGSRIGVLFVKYGIGSGLSGDQSIFEKLKVKGLKPEYLGIESSKELGSNIAGYIAGFADAGVIEGTPEMFGLPSQKRPTDEFVFAQLKHDGAWNVHPGAATTLLKRLKQHAAVQVNLKRLMVDPDKDDLSEFNFLYLTGLDDFRFSDQAVASLRRYISGGGYLVINNGLGLATFHQAVERELKRIVPTQKFTTIPANHDIYSCLTPIRSVEYTPAVLESEPELGEKPSLEAITIDDEIRVIYSKYDLEAGWQNTYYPLLKGYSNESAQLLGMNLITYLMTN